MKTLICLAATAFVLCAQVSLALAADQPQEAADSAPQTGTPPDVVTTTDGGMYRGTIISKVPDGHVELQLASGKTVKIEMSQVQYAGPKEGLSSAEPKSAKAEDSRASEEKPSNPKDEVKPTVVVVANRAQVKLRSGADPVTFHRKTGSATGVGSGGGVTVVSVASSYDEMCTTPCEVEMAAGTHTLALAPPGKNPIEAEPVTVPDGETTLRGTIIDKSGSRVAGAIAMWGGLLGGAAVMLIGVADTENILTYSAAGGGIMLGGLIVGLAVARPDEAKVEVDHVGLAPGVNLAGTF